MIKKIVKITPVARPLFFPLTHTHAYNPHPLYIVTCDRRGDLDEFFLYILCSFIFKHITDYTDNAYLLFFKK